MRSKIVDILKNMAGYLESGALTAPVTDCDALVMFAVNRLGEDGISWTPLTFGDNEFLESLAAAGVKFTLERSKIEDTINSEDFRKGMN